MMDHSEMIALIRPAVSNITGNWADLGAGTGNFTAALAALLAPHAVIYAVDRDRRAVQQLAARFANLPPASPTIYTLQSDITALLQLPPLNGLLLANVLHFIADQSALLARLYDKLCPGGNIVVVEYDLRLPRAYVPHPIAPDRCLELITAARFTEPRVVGRRRSPSGGAGMYAVSARTLQISGMRPPGD
ncbi:MAG: hypothetical protein NVS4B8_19000 [Herpetosiphon sp.]